MRSNQCVLRDRTTSSMRRAGQKDGALSTSQDPLPSLHSSPPPPLPRGRPLSDIYPLHGHAMLSGCAAVVQPVTSDPHAEESRLNGLNAAAAWSSPVIGQPEGKPPPPSRIMRLFSNPRKCTVPGHSPPGDGPPSGPNGPQAWPAVMDSFKRLRSSVLQGIQNRETAANQDECDAAAANRQADNNGTAATNHGHHGVGNMAGHLRFREGPGVSNGVSLDQRLARVSQCSSEYEGEEEEDEEDDDGDEGDGLTRNSRFSRSIRRAYRAGRISLLDAGLGRRAGGGREGDGPKAVLRSVSEVDHRAGPANENTNPRVLSRLSKSAENINLFKTPFRRKAQSPGPPPLRPDSPEAPPRPNGTPHIQRTASTSSVDCRGRSPNRLRGSQRAKGHMLKLVGSVSDLTARRRPSPSPGPAPSPAPTSPQSHLSRLHDDYSRRTPCLPAGERQRRPSPPRRCAAGGGERGGGERSGGERGGVERGGAERTGGERGGGERGGGERMGGTQAPVEHEPEAEAVRHQVLVSPVHLEPPGEADRRATPSPSPHCEAPAAAACDAPPTPCDAPPTPCSEPSRHQDTLLTKEDTSDEQRRESLLPASPAATSTPPLSPACLSDSPSSPAATDVTPTAASPTETPSSVSHRRRAGRSRPRPISDFGQLVSRKYPIPEEEAELRLEARTTNDSPGQNYSNGDHENGGSSESCGANGDVVDRRQRPISVIGGGVDLFSSPGSDREDSLPSPVSRPPLPSHQVPPYRAVSARFRPSTLSQSTPIGLDRVGRHRIHRVLSDGASECAAELDDSVSEEEGSFDELSDVTPYLQPGVELSVLNKLVSSGHAVYAEALWDHVTMEEHQLAFKAGDVIRVLDASHKDWWWGRGADREAWFPSCFVRVRVNQEDSGAESVESVLVDEEESAPRDTHSTQHKEQMRTNVIREIMNTERIYIKHLRDICEGYIRQCRKNPGMFTEEQLRTIFSNIEDLYRFQRQFLRDLEKKYNKDQPHLSEIGSCFLLQGTDGFSIYSEYCNTHPAACSELHRLMKLGRYKHFFEACRLLQQMIDISIAGFLLTPVQKICKYPLQLGELLKYTPKDHGDYSGVSDAYEAMKNVASLINERKRRLESVDTIAHWQVSILHWEGADVLERSSELIHSGELTRVVRHGKTQQRSFFLFDHQLVFCKKDVLRRDLLHYRGRLDMDQTEVSELPDGRDPDLGLSLRNALRLRHSSTLEVLCVLCCRKAHDKERWLQAFARERHRVQEDQEMGMEISEDQRKQAIFNARKSKQGKIKSIGYSGSVPIPHQNLLPIHQRHVTVPTSLPQQQVYSLAEPPKRKPAHLWYTFTRSAFFRK